MASTKCNFELLSSLDGNIQAIDCRLNPKSIEIGLLCINALVRADLKNSPQQVNLYEFGEYITTVELPQEFEGNKNGYLPQSHLKIC